jgi:hypothetical protein
LIKCDLWIATDPETGIELILTTPEEFEEYEGKLKKRKEVLEGMLSQAIAGAEEELKGGRDNRFKDVEEKHAWCRSEITRLIGLLDDIEAEESALKEDKVKHARAVPFAELREYRLDMPDYKEHMVIREEAIDKDRNIHWSKMMRACLPGAVSIVFEHKEGKTVTKKTRKLEGAEENFPPYLADALWARMYEALYPTSANVNFTPRPSSTPSTEN